MKNPTRTCDELGVRQARAPACKGCYDFAPGVISGGPRRRRFGGPVQRVLLALALAAALAAGLGFVTGWLYGGML